MNKEVRMINHLKNSLILTTLLITLISCGNSEMLFFDSNENSIVSSISVNSVEDDIIIEWATEGNPDTVISIEKSIDGITYIVIGETTAGSENYTDIDGALVASETDIVYKLNIQNVSGDSLVDLQPETIEAKTISTINYGVSSGSTYYERIDLTDKDGTRDITGEIGATEIKSSVKDILSSPITTSLKADINDKKLKNSSFFISTFIKSPFFNNLSFIRRTSPLISTEVNSIFSFLFFN